MSIIEKYLLAKVKHKKTGITGLVTSVYVDAIDGKPRITIRKSQNSDMIYNSLASEWAVLGAEDE